MIFISGLEKIFASLNVLCTKVMRKYYLVYLRSEYIQADSIVRVLKELIALSQLNP